VMRMAAVEKRGKGHEKKHRWRNSAFFHFYF
jgi:hypothetical protein